MTDTVSGGTLNSTIPYHPAPPGSGSAVVRKFWLCLTTASMDCLHLRGCGRAKIFAPPYYSQHAVFASLSVLFSLKVCWCYLPKIIKNLVRVCQTTASQIWLVFLC